jgi:hypothetical protein
MRGKIASGAQADEGLATEGGIPPTNGGYI